MTNEKRASEFTHVPLTPKDSGSSAFIRTMGEMLSAETKAREAAEVEIEELRRLLIVVLTQLGDSMTISRIALTRADFSRTIYSHSDARDNSLHLKLGPAA